MFWQLRKSNYSFLFVVSCFFFRNSENLGVEENQSLCTLQFATLALSNFGFRKRPPPTVLHLAFGERACWCKAHVQLAASAGFVPYQLSLRVEGVEAIWIRFTPNLVQYHLNWLDHDTQAVTQLNWMAVSLDTRQHQHDVKRALTDALSWRRFWGFSYGIWLSIARMRQN